MLEEITKLKSQVVQLNNEIKRLKGYSVEVDLDNIVLAISEITGVEFAEIKGRSRLYENVVARHLAFYIMRHHYGKTISSIGKYFIKDHTVVIYGIRKVELYLSMPQFYKKENDYLTQVLAKL
jgi:chromosomal replication initiation ATPase DnaA